MIAFKQLQSEDRIQNTFQKNVTDFLQQLSSLDILNGHQINDIDLETGNNNVAHGLDGKLSGWIVVGVDAAQSIYEVSKDVRFLVLNASGPVTVNLWVY